MRNRAMYMTGIRKMKLDIIYIPEPAVNEVLVKLEYVGICGSDVHFFEHGRIGDYVVEGDYILGHECAGVVVKTGPGVSKLKVGDKVALEPGIVCGQCKYCKSGKYNLCPDVVFLATPPYHGCLKDYITYPENMTFKLPDNISTKEGALIEPLAVGMHAASQGNVRIGDSVVILGAGCIGLVTLLACKASGATNVIVTDVLSKRLEYAKKLGANAVINSKEEDIMTKVKNLTGGVGADVVIETAGSEITIAQTADLVCRGGRIVLVGLAPKEIIPYNFMSIMCKEAEIKSVFRYRNMFPICINAVADGKINISDIVTHEFEFEKSEDAFNFVIDNKTDVVKAVIRL